MQDREDTPQSEPFALYTPRNASLSLPNKQASSTDMQYIKFLAIISTVISVVSALPADKRGDPLLSLAREESTALAGEESAVAEGPKTDVIAPDPDCFILFPCINWKRVL
ncbi:hypothetical protein B0H19DRAFT_1379498 [Mycena capillaripes]|nr:hypothetical protein B0H19DRAFT_1379498 [Mycena capillaripes]